VLTYIVIDKYIHINIFYYVFGDTILYLQMKNVSLRGTRRYFPKNCHTET